MLPGPLALPLWLAGLAALAVRPELRRFCALGLGYLALLGLFIVLRAKDYYLAPVYPVCGGRRGS